MAAVDVLILVALMILESVVAQDLFSCNFAVIENYYNDSRWLVPTDMIAIEVFPYRNTTGYIGYEFRCTNDTSNGLYNLSIVSYDYLNQFTFLDLNDLNFNVTGYYCGESQPCDSLQMRYLDRAVHDSTGANCSGFFGVIDVHLLTNNCHQYSSNMSMIASDCSEISYYSDFNCTSPILNYSDTCLFDCISNSSLITTTSFQTTGIPQTTVSQESSFSSYCNAVNMGIFAIPIGTCAYKRKSENYNESLLFQCGADGSLLQYSYPNLNCTGVSNMTNVTTTYEDKYVCNAVLNCSVLTITLGSANTLLVLNDTDNGVSGVLNANLTCTYDQYDEAQIVSSVCISGSSNSSQIIGCNSHGDILRYSYNNSNCFGDGFIDIQDFICPKCSGQTVNQLSNCPSVVIGRGTIPLNRCLSNGIMYTCSDDGLLLENVYSNSNCSGSIFEKIEVVENEWFCGSNNSNNSNNCNYFTIQVDDNECSNEVNGITSTSIFLTDICTNLPNGTSTKYTNCTNNSINYYLYSNWNCTGSIIESTILNQCVQCSSSNGTSITTTTTTTTTAMPISKTLGIVNWVQWNGFTFPTELCVGAITMPLQLRPNQLNVPNVVYAPVSLQFFCLNARQSNSELLVAVYGNNDDCDSDNFHLYYGSELGVSNYSCSGFDIADFLTGEIAFINGSQSVANETSFPRLIRLNGYKNLLYVNESLLNDTNYIQAINVLNDTGNNRNNNNNNNNDNDNGDDADSNDSRDGDNNNRNTNRTCSMRHEYTFLIFPETCVYDTTYNISWKLMSCNQSTPLIYFYTNSSNCIGNYTLNHDLMNCFTSCNREETINGNNSGNNNNNNNNTQSGGIRETGISVIMLVITVLALLH